jgi:6-pyruvoyltetrahydropterin/6-carboxytetrahydropterin synthase
MIVKIAKEYRWEMSHRLPFHTGNCRNIHGHSYKLRVEIEGTPDKNSMVLDYYELDKIVLPFIAKFDHSFICDEEDTSLIKFLEKGNQKFNIISSYTTAENIAALILSEMVNQLKHFKNLNRLIVRIYETPETFAEIQSDL